MLRLLYIDPGSGSFIVQVLISAVLTVGFFFRSIVDFFRFRIFRKNRGEKDQPK